MKKYEGECIGGPWDGEVWASERPWLRGTAYFDAAGMVRQAKARKGWSDPVTLRDVWYRWSAEQRAWVPGKPDL